MSISKRMTAFIAALLVAVLVAPAIAGAATAPAVDVPRDHWAYDAVNLMISKGYMGVYDTGKFVGDDPVSRYLLAFVVAKLLQDVEAGRTALSEEDMRVVRELSTTLREQLAVVISRMGELERLAANASAVAASAQDTTARASLDSAARYMELKAAIEQQRSELDAQLKLNAEASDQKLSALYGDLRNQHADLAGTVSAGTAEMGARVGAVETSLQTGLAAEQEARAQLERDFAASLDGVKATQAGLALELDAVKKDSAAAAAAAQSAAAAQIAVVKADQAAQLGVVKDDIARLTAFDAQASSQLAGLQLKVDELALSIGANRVWAEGAIAAALEAEAKNRTSAISEAVAAERAAWGAAIASEASTRAASDEGLDKRLAALELNLTSTAAAAVAAATAEAANRVEGLDALNKQVAALAAEFEAELAAEAAARAGAVAAERAAWEGAITSEATKRAAEDAGLSERIATLELNLTTATAAAATATKAEATLRAEAVEGLNKRIAEQAAEFSARLATAEATQAEAITGLSQKLDAESAARSGAIAAERAAWEGAIASEAAKRAAGDAGLDQRLAVLELNLTSTASAAVAATTAEAAVRAESLEAVNRRIAELAAEFDAGIEDAVRRSADADAALRADLDRAAQELSLAQAETDQRVAANEAAIAAESEARKREAAAILNELRSAAASMQGDLERKIAEADGAILAAMERELEAERAKLSATQSDVAQLAAAVGALESRASAIQAQLDELAKKQSNDYSQQRQALVDLKASLDLLSKQITDKLAANAAEDARTASKGLENSMAIDQIIAALNETRDVLNDTISSLNSTDADVAALDERLASMERVIQGSVEELEARFADDIIAERWEAEAREIKLQQMIEDLQRRVEQLEAGGKAEAKPAMSTGALLGILGGVGALAAIIAIASGAGGGAPTP